MTLLDDAEIIRRLRSIRYSDPLKRYGRHLPSINSIASRTGISREYIFRIAATGKGIGPKSRASLSVALSSERSNGERSGVPSPQPEPPSAVLTRFRPI